MSEEEKKEQDKNVVKPVDERVFTIKINDEDVEFFIKDPSLKDIENARTAYTDKYNRLVAKNGIFRSVLEKKMKENGLWTDVDENRYNALQQELDDNIDKILKGGIKKATARKYAIRVREIREQMRNMKGELASQMNNTIEGQSSNEEFNYLLTCCLVYNNDRNKRYFNSVDEYLNSTNDPVAIVGAIKFAQLSYGLGASDEELPENQFLRQFNFINENLQLVDENGKLIDSNGKYVDEFGRYIKYIKDKKGNETTIFVDIDGREVDDRGRYKFDKIKYLD